MSESTKRTADFVVRCLTLVVVTALLVQISFGQAKLMGYVVGVESNTRQILNNQMQLMSRAD